MQHNAHLMQVNSFLKMFKVTTLFFLHLFPLLKDKNLSFDTYMVEVSMAFR